LQDGLCKMLIHPVPGELHFAQAAIGVRPRPVAASNGRRTAPSSGR
jgi:hypothetical protein